MGIDFNNLINLGKTLAKTDGGKNENVIEGKSIEVFKSAVENEAATKGIDTSEIYSDTNIASLMGAEFSKTTAPEKQEVAQTPAFSDEEISLENMMALLDDDVDLEKVAEHNKKGTSFGVMVNSGISPELAGVIDGTDIDTEALANHTSNPINDKFNHVRSNAEEFGEDAPLANLILALAPDYLV